MKAKLLIAAVVSGMFVSAAPASAGFSVILKFNGGAIVTAFDAKGRQTATRDKFTQGSHRGVPAQRTVLSGRPAKVCRERSGSVRCQVIKSTSDWVVFGD